MNTDDNIKIYGKPSAQDFGLHFGVDLIFGSVHIKISVHILILPSK